MKKAIALLLLFSFLISLCACTKVTKGKLLNTDVEVVEAVVTGLYHLRPERGVIVECDGAKSIISSEALYEKYKNRLGEIIICNLITRTYENTITMELVYSVEN